MAENYCAAGIWPPLSHGLASAMTRLWGERPYASCASFPPYARDRKLSIGVKTLAACTWCAPLPRGHRDRGPSVSSARARLRLRQKHLHPRCPDRSVFVCRLVVICLIGSLHVPVQTNMQLKQLHQKTTRSITVKQLRHNNYICISREHTFKQLHRKAARSE